MGTRARVASVGQAGQFKPTVQGNVEHVMSLVDIALREKPDLVCLPEAFHDVGMDRDIERTAEPLDGPTISAFASKARGARCYIVCPIHTREHDRIYNSAVLLDRSGQVAGVYHKVCPVTTSPDYTVFEGVSPGDSLPVFDLDFGRVGIQICFDIGFPENWQALAEKGVRMVLWPSAYDGGFPLRCYAYLHHYWVMSSTRSGRTRVIDPVGEILKETTDSSPVIVRNINLDYVVCHLDWNYSVEDRIKAKYGDRVDVRTWDPGSGHFIVEPKDPSVTCARLQEEFGFESTFEYHNRCRAAYKRIRDGKPPVPQRARHGNRPQWGK